MAKKKKDKELDLVKSIVDTASKINEQPKKTTSNVKQKKYADIITTDNTTPNSEGYTPTNKKYGDYKYQNYLKNKDYQIYKKDGKAYYYNGKNYIDMDTPTLTSKEQDKKDYEEAVKNGFKGTSTYNEKGKQVEPSKTADKVELDTSGLTKKEKKKYKKAIIQQEQTQGKKDTFVRKSGTGIDALTGAYENQVVNPDSVINKNFIQPAKNWERIYESGKLSNENALEWYNKMEGKKNKVKETEENIEKFNKFNQDVASGDIGIGGSAIQNLNTQVESLKKQGIVASAGGLLGSGVGLVLGAKSGNPLGGAVKGAKLGAQAGYTVGSTPYMYKLEAGNEYKDLIEMGVSHKKARNVARAVGAINAAIESGENIIDLLSFEGAGKALGGSGLKSTAAKTMTKEVGDIVENLGEEEAQNYLTKKFGPEAAKLMLQTYFKNSLSEGGEEMSQEAVSILGERYGTASEGIKRDATLLDDIKRVGQAGLSGTTSALLTGAPTSFVGNTTSYMFNNIQNKNNNIQIQKVQSLNEVEREALTEIAMKNKSGQPLTQQDMTILQFLNQKANKNVMYSQQAQQNPSEAYNEIYNGVFGNTFGGSNLSIRDNYKEAYNTNEKFRNILENMTDEEYNKYYDSNIIDSAYEYGLDIPKPTEKVKDVLDDWNKNAVGDEKIDIDELKKKYPNFEKILDLSVEDYYTQQQQANKTKNEKTEQVNISNNISKEDKINNFRNSIKKENIQDKTGFYKAVEKVIADKDYNVVMDSSIKNSNGQPVNAQISNENGITIKINPNSERAGEILLTHEITHAIETEKMRKMILDYASKKSEFNEALEDLKKSYGTDEVTPEVIADISGELFGNQEFIYDLSTENPSLFSKIYNEIKYLWHQLTGYKNENKFIEDLHYKWEKAYRESNIESAQKNLQNEIKYSQSNNIAVTDNQGRKLSDGQMKKFKDSAIKDNEGHLITVYHSTGDTPVRPFYEFNPVGSKNYKYGNDIVNFYTDNSKMADAYFGDTKFENIDTSKNADTSKKGRWKYEGYLNIKNPYIIDCKGRAYHNAVVQFTNEMDNVFSQVEKHKEELHNLAVESENKYKNTVGKAIQEENRLSNKILDNLDIDEELIEIIKNENIDDYEDFYNKAKKTGLEVPSPNETIEDIVGDLNFFEELEELYEDRVSKFQDAKFKDFIKMYNDYKKSYNKPSIYFEQNYKDIIGKILEENNELEDERYYAKGIDTFTGEDWYNISKEMFSQESKEKNAPVKYQYTTNDVVKYIVNENKTKLENQKYDGVIFKNIYDLPGDGVDLDIFHDANGNKISPGNVYVTFNSNQFKAFDNKNPTDNPDIRYSQNTGKWQEFLNKYFAKNNKGTKTYFNEKPTEITAKNNSGQEIKLKQDKNNPIVYNQEAIDRDTEDLNKLFKNRTVSKGDLRVSNIYSNLTEKSKFIDMDIREFFKTEDDLKFYKKVSNEESLVKANEKIGNTVQSQQKAFEEFLAKDEQFDSIDMAEGWIFLKRFNDSGNYDASYLTAKKMKEMGTKSGQAIQILNLESRLTPEGMYRWATHELLKAEKAFNSEKGRTKREIVKYRDSFRLTQQETQFLKDQMEKIQKMPDGREKNIELAKINSMLQDKLPHQRGQSLKAWVRMAMLLNPKTQIRNLAGNSLIMPVNAVSDVFGGLVDRAVAKKTGVRTLGGPSPGGFLSYIKGFAGGVKESTQDYRMGIDTKDVNQNKFEIGQGKQFNEKHTGPLKGLRNKNAKFLNAMNNFLGYIMDAGDRGFLNGSVENSLYNQMKLNNSKEITHDMIEIAQNEGLQRTWNDNNDYTQAVLDLRRSINTIGNQMHLKVGEYGLGDLIIPFAKTPANLTKAIVDYSPVGFLNAITEGKNLKRAIETENYTPQMQHDFAQTVGKATAGTILYILGTALAKAKITTGNSDDDKDLKKFMRENLGIQPYSIKIGDKSFTYDWAQPIAAPFAITADIERGKEQNMTPAQALQQFLNTGFNILTEQSFLSGINQVLNNDDGVLNGIEQQIINLPATAIPTFLKQIADMTDGTKRQTYTKEGMIENMKKTARSKIPYLPFGTKSLAPQIDVLGNEVEKYGGNNNFFNVMINPANTDKGKMTPVAKEIYSLYEATGDKTIIPRKVDYTTKINGENKILTAEEIAQWQKASGKRVSRDIEEAMDNEIYQNMSNEEKALVINRIVNYSYQKAKSETFNTPLANMYKKPSEAESKGIPIADYYISVINKNLKNN